MLHSLLIMLLHIMQNDCFGVYSFVFAGILYCVCITCTIYNREKRLYYFYVKLVIFAPAVLQ